MFQMPHTEQRRSQRTSQGYPKYQDTGCSCESGEKLLGSLFRIRRKKGLVYVDFSKKYFVSGSLFSITEKKNMTQERLSDLNRVDVSQIPLEDALVMGDPKAKIRMIAFDDPD